MRVSRLVALGILAVALPVAALASHGKVGLWQVTVKMSGQMPQVPPDQLAKMKSMGITIPNANAMTVRRCMSAAEVAADQPPTMQHNKDCSMTNTRMVGDNFRADMVCKGAAMNGNGHVSISYDSDTHYSGKMTFAGMAQGRPVSTVSVFDGKWVSADCGGMAH